MSPEVWQITPRPRPPLEELAGPWALIHVNENAFLLPCRLLRRHPAAYAWAVVGGHVREWLTESEGLQAMGACRDTRMGRGH